MSPLSLLRPPLARFFWIGLALIVKGGFFSWYLTQTYKHDIDGFWGQSNGDMMTYIQPVESLLSHGGFRTDDRMPGYPAVYLLVRLVCSPPVACNVLIILQLIVSAISVYVLGLCAVQLFRTKRAFYWAYFIYLLSTFVSVFDAYFLTESFAASAAIFFLHTWLRFEEKPDRWLPLVMAGAWLAWSVFLKPAHLPLLAIPVGIWGLRWLRGRLNLKQAVRHSALFLLPFLVADTGWMVRNYQRYQEVIPLLKSPWYTHAFWPANYFDMVTFCQSYGEDFGYWFPNTDMRWLLGWGNNKFLPPLRWYKEEHLGPPPDYVYTDKFNRDSIILVRNLYYELDNKPGISDVRKKEIEARVKTSLNRYTRSIREDNPLVYYIWAPIRYGFTFLNGTWGYNFLDDMVPAQWPRLLLRLYHYVLVLIPGLIGLFLLTGRGWRFDDRQLFIPAAFAYCFIIYVIVLRHAETRYLAPFYPFLLLSAVGTFLTVTRSKQAHKPTVYDVPFRNSADL